MTKLAGDHVQVLVGGYELTGDSNSITISEARDMYDVTTFGDAVHKFIGGRRLISLDHAGFVDAGVGRSHPVLKEGAFSGMVSVLVGQNAAPVAGDPMFSLPVLQGQYKSLTEFNKALPFAAKFATLGYQGGWGKALAAPTQITNSANGAAQDNGAATSKGGAVFLHILTAAASDTYSFVVQGSTASNFSSPTTLATFTLNGSAVNSQRIAIAGAIPQYTRWVATRTGSAGNPVKFAINLVRF